jgi:hypothetical protein
VARASYDRRAVFTRHAQLYAQVLGVAQFP